MSSPGQGRRFLLVTPIAPAPSGNGLAMRAALAVEGLAREADVWAAVVPVAGPAPDEAALAWTRERSRDAAVVAPDPPHAALRGWLSSATAGPILRDALPLPARALAASPAVGARIARAWPALRFDAVYVLRAYLGGTALPFGEAADPPALALDADDNDAATLLSIAALHKARGEAERARAAADEAAAFDRLARRLLPRFDLVLAAAPEDAAALAERHDVAVETLPNGVAIPPEEDRRSRAGAGPAVLFVGNLGYPPNLDAVERLAREILPAIRRRHPEATLELVGAGGGDAAARLASLPGVAVRGFVADLAPAYRRASLVVAPLRAGGGSSLKLLEAFARGVPVVATPTAARGTAAVPGRHYLAGDTPEALAEAAVAVWRDPGLARALAADARRLVERDHALPAVAAGLARRMAFPRAVPPR